MIQNSLLSFVNQVILMLSSWHLNEKADRYQSKVNSNLAYIQRPTVNIVVVYSRGSLNNDDNDLEDDVWKNVYFNFEFRCYLDLFSTRSDLNPYSN